jgi:hypothetical protein
MMYECKTKYFRKARGSQRIVHAPKRAYLAGERPVISIVAFDSFRDRHIHHFTKPTDLILDSSFDGIGAMPRVCCGHYSDAFAIFLHYIDTFGLWGADI